MSVVSKISVGLVGKYGNKSFNLVMYGVGVPKTTEG